MVVVLGGGDSGKVRALTLNIHNFQHDFRRLLSKNVRVIFIFYEQYQELILHFYTILSFP